MRDSVRECSALASADRSVADQFFDSCLALFELFHGVLQLARERGKLLVVGRFLEPCVVIPFQCGIHLLAGGPLVRH